MAAPVVVIGYGNPLRGDDVAGPAVAAAVARRRWPAVQALAVHQLTPELADVLAGARLVIFVDARAGAADSAVAVHALEPATAPTSLGHVSRPGDLLGLARALHGHCPPSLLVTVAAEGFAPGEALSPTAARGAAAAVDRIAELVGVSAGAVA